MKQTLKSRFSGILAAVVIISVFGIGVMLFLNSLSPSQAWYGPSWFAWSNSSTEVIPGLH